MKYTKFPGSEREVSKLGFGAMGLSVELFGKHEDSGLVQTLLYTLAQSVNFIDTDRAYRRSDTIIGKVLKEWLREQPFIATK